MIDHTHRQCAHLFPAATALVVLALVATGPIRADVTPIGPQAKANASLLAVKEDHLRDHVEQAKNSPGLIAAVLDNGALVDAADRSGHTMLIWASNRGYIDSVKLLIERGADVNYLMHGEFTALKAAAAGGSVDCATYLIAHGAQVNDRKPGYDPSALSLAAEFGHLDCVKLLISNGATVNATDRWGKTPLMLAADAGNRDSGQNEGCVRYLISVGADIDARDKLHRTVLWYGARGLTNFACVRMLISKRTDINDTDAGGSTVLMAAARGGDLECVKFLIAYGADINAVDNSGRTALMEAAFNDNHYELGDEILPYLSEGQTDCVAYLISLGANVYSQDAKGRTALRDAADSGDAASVDYLITAGANINAKDGKGRTPLISACAKRDLDRLEIPPSPYERYNNWVKSEEKCVKILIDNGASINATDQNGRTALMEAASWDNRVFVRLLLTAGANVNARDDKEKWALTYPHCIPDVNIILGAIAAVDMFSN